MAIQFLDGSVLIRGGDIATNSDCCCTPPCYPDPCIIPSCSNCNKCWDTGCGECRTLQSMEVTITGVGDATVCAAPSGDCCYGFNGCNCSIFNSTFIHDFTSNSRCWSVFPFAQDNCGTSQSLGCGGIINFKSVFIQVYFANQPFSLTAGGPKSIQLPCINAYGYVCQDYTVGPGHVVFVFLNSTIFYYGQRSYDDEKLFVYNFNNSAKSDVDCPDDQRWAQCNWIGGQADLILSSKRRLLLNDLIYDADCDNFDVNCDLSNAVVTIEPPVMAPCTEEEGP